MRARSAAFTKRSLSAVSGQCSVIYVEVANSSSSPHQVSVAVAGGGSVPRHALAADAHAGARARHVADAASDAKP